jgi:epoxyqueuosine reductase
LSAIYIVRRYQIIALRLKWIQSNPEANVHTSNIKRMELKDEIKEFGQVSLDIDRIGVTNVERLSGAPEGYRPTDILPGAKSVIVMGVRLSLGAVQTIYRAHEDGLRHLQCIYGTHGYALTPNYHLKFAAYRLARFLEKKGFLATPLPSGPGAGGVPFSHRHAAVAAGLGEFGWMGIVLTPDYGPRIRWVSVITRAEIEPDSLLDGPALCDPAACGVCISVCPTGAISATESKQVMMGGRSIEYTALDVAKCRIGAEGLTKKNLGLKDLQFSDNPTIEEVDAADVDPRQLREAILPIHRGTYYCGQCLAHCPVGNERERGLLAGLSKRQA